MSIVYLKEEVCQMSVDDRNNNNSMQSSVKTAGDIVVNESQCLVNGSVTGGGSTPTVSKSESAVSVKVENSKPLESVNLENNEPVKSVTMDNSKQLESVDVENSKPVVSVHIDNSKLVETVNVDNSKPVISVNGLTEVLVGDSCPTQDKEPVTE